jgi:hypothetical protein
MKSTLKGANTPRQQVEALLASELMHSYIRYGRKVSKIRVSLNIYNLLKRDQAWLEVIEIDPNLSGMEFKAPGV